MKNRAYIEYYKQGLIIGNNINVEYGLTDNDKEEDDEKFDGALVADPTLNDYTGIEVFGYPSMYVFDNVVDMDFSSMYPHIIITFNVAPNTMIGKLIIGGDIQEAYKNASDDGKVEDAGKDFVDNMLVGNVANMGTKWFNLPNIMELKEMIKKRFNISDKKKITIRANDVNKYYLEPFIIEIGDVDNE